MSSIAVGQSAGTETGSNPERLRIIYIHDGLYPYFKGGAEKRFYETAKALAEKHDVSYITWQYWDGPSTVTRDGVTLHGVGPAPSFYGEDGKRKISESFAFAVAATKKLATLPRADIVDCCATPLMTLLLTSVVAKVRRERFVTTWHEFWGEYWLEYLPQRRSVARLAQLIERAAAGRSAQIVAVSEFTARKLRRAMPSATISVIGNGVDLDVMDGCEAATDAPDVLFAGRLIDAKRIDNLVRAMRLVVARHPAATCFVVGDGPERANIEQLIALEGLEANVKLLGFVDEQRLYSLMKGTKVFALPSVREGFGMAVVEAQACGAVPVVVEAPANAAATLVNHETDGLICGPTADSLSEIILRLLDDDVWRQELAANALLTRHHRTWPVLCDRTEELYLTVAREQRKQAA